MRRSVVGVTSLAATILAAAAMPASSFAYKDACAHKSGTAKQRCRISVHPANPVVDEPVTVTFHPAKPLRRGYVYQVIVAAGTPGCSGTGLKLEQTRGRSVTLSSVGSSGPEEVTYEWCRGTAEVVVVEKSEGDEKPYPEDGKPYLMIGTRFFRFVGKP